MKPYQLRVIEEQKQLKQRTDAVRVFIDSVKFDAIDGAEQDRMYKQLAIMHQYGDVLGHRIAAFS